MIASRDDDTAFERVVNTPTRGIGDRTIVALRECAAQNQVSLWRAAEILLERNSFAARAANALALFLKLINTLADDTQHLALYERTEHVIQNSGLIELYRKERGEKGLARIENLEELVNAARQFEATATIEGVQPLTAFLSNAALESGNGQAETFEDCVQLMTLHSAKGLEFPVVFMCGVEEGLFPHYMVQEDPTKIEEERRLCYVGMTRAMEKLFLTYAESRRLHGKEVFHRPSRFIKDIPKEFLDEVRLKAKVSRPQTTSSYSRPMPENDTGLRMGQRVTHHQFGEGIILQYEGRGEHARIQVRFENSGTKWLIASFVVPG